MAHGIPAFRVGWGSVGRVLPRILFAGLVVFSLGVSAGLWAGPGVLRTSRYSACFWWLCPVFFLFFCFVWRTFLVSLSLSLVCVCPLNRVLLSGNGGVGGFLFGHEHYSLGTICVTLRDNSAVHLYVPALPTYSICSSMEKGGSSVVNL